MQKILSWLLGPVLSAEPTAAVNAVPAKSLTPIGNSHLLPLFGAGAVPWNTSTVEWHAVDDRVRGGSSQSYLTLADPDQSKGSAIFSGTLDTKTLGGAGFASQSTTTSNSSDGADVSGTTSWDLSAYDGLLLTVESGDSKKYVLSVKDTLPGKREDGRERSGISWEFVFEGPEAGNLWKTVDCENQKVKTLEMPWKNFTATYRGREQEDAPPLKTKEIKQFGLMMRSFFDEQDGDFSLKLRGIQAAKL